MGKSVSVQRKSVKVKYLILPQDSVFTKQSNKELLDIIQNFLFYRFVSIRSHELVASKTINIIFLVSTI